MYKLITTTKSMLGYKKVKNKKGEYFLVTLQIPSRTVIFHSGTFKDKSRCSKAKVLKIEQLFKVNNIRCYDLRDYMWKQISEPVLFDKYDFFKGRFFDQVLQDQKLRLSVTHLTILHNKPFKYIVGEVVKPERPFCRKLGSCRSGIHFFRDKQTALIFSM